MSWHDLINTVICGDCLEVMKDLPDGCVDLILADPPYGTTACKWDSIIPLEPMWKQLKRVIKPNGAIVMTGSQPFTTTLIASNMEMFRYEWIWNKKMVTGIATCKKLPMKSHENILVFYKKQPTYNWQKRTVLKPFGKIKAHESENYNGFVFSEDQNSGVGYPNTIIETPRQNNLTGGGQHPTQKPVALMQYLINTYTNEGELVLDFVAGSGTTGVAAQSLNRRFILIELEQKYVDIANERLKQEVMTFHE